MNNKEFKAVVKSAKIDLKKEVSSVSFWVNTVAKAAQSGDCRKAVMHTLKVDKLPAKEELKKALLGRALDGFKFYSEGGEILICKKSFKRDATGQVVRENGSPIVEKIWYEKKETFSFIAVWQAIFNPQKVRVTIPAEEIK